MSETSKLVCEKLATNKNKEIIIINKNKEIIITNKPLFKDEVFSFDYPITH